MNNFSERIIKCFNNIDANELPKEALNIINNYILNRKKLRPKYNPNLINKRIAYVGEFDNDHILYSWHKVPVIEAELMARDASLKDKNKEFYVVYYDDMDSGPGLSWKNGKFYFP